MSNHDSRPSLWHLLDDHALDTRDTSNTFVTSEKHGVALYRSRNKITGEWTITFTTMEGRAYHITDIVSYPEVRMVLLLRYMDEIGPRPFFRQFGKHRIYNV